MPQEFVITPQVAAEPAAWLNRQTEQLDRLLDHPIQGPQPIGQSGLLEQIGGPELGFLGRHPWCVLARRTRGDGRNAPRSAARPLRLLLFIASPENLPPERRQDPIRSRSIEYNIASSGPFI